MEDPNYKNITIVYPVAGISSRFGGKSKALAKIKEEETLIEHSLNQALSTEINEIIFIVGKNTEKNFKEKFGKEYKGIPIQYALQKYDENKRTRPWGTADALCSAKHLIKNPFIYCNGDDIYGANTFQKLVDLLKNSQDSSLGYTLGYKLDKVLPKEKTKEVNRAIFKIKDNYVINLEETLGISRMNLKEKKLSLEDLCSMNIFALHPESLNYLCEKVREFKEKFKENKTKECLLPNILSELINEGKMKMKIYPAIDNWIGITYPEDLETLKEKIKNKITQPN